MVRTAKIFDKRLFKSDVVRGGLLDGLFNLPPLRERRAAVLKRQNLSEIERCSRSKGGAASPNAAFSSHRGRAAGDSSRL